MSSLERLGAATAPAAPADAPPASLRGRRYGEDRLHLLVRDPRRVFTTWEVSGELARRAAAMAAAAGAPLRYALALERADHAGDPPRQTIRVPLPDALGGEGWMVDLPAGGGACRALLGLDLPGGFEPLLGSRWMPVPPEGACREVGEWPVDDVRRAWLRLEAERQRGSAAPPPLPASASRYLLSPETPRRP